MPQTKKKPTAKSTPKQSPLQLITALPRRIWRRGWFQRILLSLMALVIVVFGVSYGVAQWYIASQRDKPLVWGATFSPHYAEYFGLDPKETLDSMITDLGLKQLRLVSYWSKGEETRGQYDFSTLDWQFAMAEKHGVKISLAIGLRQPRWPECHMPTWAEQLPMTEWAPLLKDYMQATVERYKNSPSLVSYQLENEFFMTVFGICPDHSRERLVDEFNFLRSLDDTRPIIVSRSNNWGGIPIGDPTPDVSAVSVYKRVWDKTISKRYAEYPHPPWFYAMLGGFGKIVNGNDLIIHELQAEAWLPEGGYKMNRVSDIPEQNKSLDADRLRNRIQYGRDTGLREIYLWGVEWWYWQKVVADKPDLWNTAKAELAKDTQQ
jgi:hypothetical protein